MKQTNIKISKAFTLLELLIATTIFVGVMLMASTAITNSSNYLSRLKAMRVSSEESRRIADLFSEDIKKANTELTVKYIPTGSVVAVSKIYESGMALFDCSVASLKCDPKHFDTTNQSINNSDITKFNANTLVLAQKGADGTVIYKVYFNNSHDTTSAGLVLYDTESALAPDLTVVNNFSKTTNIISGEKVLNSALSNNITINFGGYAPDNVTLATASKRQQPYVFYNILVSTTRGDTFKKQELYHINVLSGVTSRNYN